jgi:predicted glutamine amidotransferase
MCGIFGIITPKPKKLDKATFNVLGIENDSRGGDSCGIFIDGKVEYGVDKKKLYTNFWKDSKLLAQTTHATIALGHCRKASVGAVNEANAQPVVIKEGNDIKFVLMHNGTINNYEELAAKYIPDIDIKGMTDSQVMARIFYHKGYDALGEYMGAGVFVIVDYRTKTPTIMFFKGESKLTSNSDKPSAERPLFVSYSKGEFIFSSLYTYLEALTVISNALCELKDGELYIIEKYDRSKCYQSKPAAYTVYKGGQTYINSASNLYFGKDEFWDAAWDTQYFTDAVEYDDDGTYSINGQKCHGSYYLNKLGDVTWSGKGGAVQCWFWRGVLLYNAQCYYYLIDFMNELKCTPIYLMDMLPELVHYLGPLPYTIGSKGNWMKATKPHMAEVFNGVVNIPFTSQSLIIKQGKLINTIEGVPYNAGFKLLAEHKDFVVNKEAINKANAK